MGSPYASQSQSGYNSNPPADDGSATTANTVFWSTIKTKLGDPALTLSQNINTALVTAFGKIIGGGGVTSTAVDYTVQGSDQGKLVRATASGITITTPDATSVLSPFVFAALNNSSGTITLDGNGSQTIDGNATITLPAGGGTMLFTDGTNWFTTGIQGTLVGKQLAPGDIINGTITESNGSNAVTFSLKTLAGNDPSASDPVLICFRNATAGTGNYVYRTVTSATSLTISSGSTMGTSNATAFRLWLVLFDDAGTIRLGAINCLSGTNIYPLGQNPIASSTAEGGAGAADSAQVFYTGTAVTSKAYAILATATYESGLTTAGSWNASPTKIRLFDKQHSLPGQEIQNIEVLNSTGDATASGTYVVLSHSEISITPTSAANIIRLKCVGSGVNTTAPNVSNLQFSRGTTAATGQFGSLLSIYAAQNSAYCTVVLAASQLAASTSSVTYAVQGKVSGGTLTVPVSGDVLYLSAREIVA